MIIQNNNFYFPESENWKNDKVNMLQLDNYSILSEQTFIFNDEKNYIVKKQIIKQLGEKSNLWKK